MSDGATDFEERRRPLVESFLDLGEQRAPLALQFAIAAELRCAEMAVNQRTPDVASHKRLLRVIGDSLAFTFLHEHTVRTLSRHPGQSANLTGQGDDFAFTMDVAQALAQSGYVPILCDLTNVLKVGDIVAVAAEHVLILECKKTVLPARLQLNGRLARQRARGSDAAEYLRTSSISEADGTRQAIRFQRPQPRWETVCVLAEALTPGSPGAQMCLLGPGDGVGLATSDADLRSFLAKLAALVSGTSPMVATHLGPLLQPSWRCRPSLVFPLPRWTRHALFEAQAVMVRLVDLDRLATTGRTTSGVPAQLQSLHSAHHAQLAITVGSHRIELGPWLVEMLMHTPMAVADLQQALISQADMLVATSPEDCSDSDDYETRACRSDTTADAANSLPYLADGDDVTYGTVYTNSDGHQHVVYEVPGAPLARRFHVAWSPSQHRISAVYRDGLRVDDPELLAELAAPETRRDLSAGAP